MNKPLRYWPSPAMQIISHRELEDTIRIFHSYCDPCDMFPEDVEVWRKWDRKLNPENYDDIQNEERDSSTQRRTSETQTS